MTPDPRIDELERELARVKSELAETRLVIAAMRQSKFWKARELWWRAKDRARDAARLARSLGDLRRARMDEIAEQSRAPEPAELVLARELPSALDPVRRASARADIVICIHNAPEDVKACLSSVVQHTRPPYSLILVDDGSDSKTRDLVSAFAQDQGALLLRNETAAGYTRAANQGLRRTSGDYAVLLNSDTLVTPDWLDRLVRCAESDPRIGLVGPLSNCASWQSVPEIFAEDGDWAENALAPGLTASGAALLVARASARAYPRLPLLNGFCLLIRREALNAIGLFDETAFGAGYGEENDYCFRAADAGFTCAVADDAYVFHHQSRSYSHERRRPLVEAAAAALARKHGQDRIDRAVVPCRSGRVLQGVRARNRAMQARRRFVADGRSRWEGRRVLFVLPVVERGGGANVVLREAQAMAEMGVDSRVVNLADFRAGFQKSYPDPGVPVLFAERAAIPALARRFDAVVATANTSVSWIQALAEDPRPPVLGYYIQDFEPYFYPKGTPGFETAWASYRAIPNLVRFAKTDWNRTEVETQIGVDCAVVGPSFDVDAFRPRISGPPATPVRIAAMIRPSTPRRQPELTLGVLEEIAKRHGDAVEIVLFGVDAGDPEYAPIRPSFPHRLIGVVDTSGLVSLFNQVHVFADFSAFQAMGLVAMEAMACGAAAVVPRVGGASSFARDGESALFCDTGSQSACVEALERLVADADLRGRIASRGLLDVVDHSPERTAFHMLSVLFPR